MVIPITAAIGKGVGAAGRAAGKIRKGRGDPWKNPARDTKIPQKPTKVAAPKTPPGAAKVPKEKGQKVPYTQPSKEPGLMSRLALGSLKKGTQFAGSTVQKSQGGWILIFPFLLAVLDFILGKNGIPLDFLWNNPGLFAETVTRIIFHSPYWVFLVIYLILRKPFGKPDVKNEIMFPAVLFLIGFLTVTFGGWNNWIFIHMVFAVLTFAFLLNGFNSNRQIGQEHWVFLVIFVLDIFGLATLKGLNAGIMGGVIPAIFLNRIIFPIWFFYYLALIKDSGFKTGMSIAIVLFYAGYIGFNYVGAQNVEIQDLDIEKMEAGGFLKTSVENWGDAMSLWLSRQVEYAITGKVEENQYEPLGVYLENVQSADPKYYADENIIIWGTVKARTLDDPIDITVGCYAKRDDTERYASKVDPAEGAVGKVFSYEEQDFVCEFSDSQNWGEDEEQALKVGSNVITTFADFNFETLAYLKTYFIDNERRRAMVREGLDVFDEFEIKDKNPISIYTNGPVEIGMETTTPLISVGSGYPYLSISIQNRQGWEGEITGLHGLTLFFPPGVNFEGCTRAFKPGGCEDSCETDECRETCTSLSEGGYTAYSLDLDDPEVKDYLGEFEKFKLFRCRFTPDASILGNAPIKTEYFRAKAKYDYTLEKTVTAKIIEVPEVLDRGNGDDSEDADDGNDLDNGGSDESSGNGCSATLYDDRNYGGDKITLGGDSKTLEFNDKAESIEVSGGCTVTLYDDKNYGGNYRTYTSSISDLEDDDFNDKAESVKVSGDCTVTLYDDRNYGGDKITLGGDSNVLKFNDKAESVMISGDCIVTLYDDKNYGGNYRTYTSSISDLEDDDFNDKAESVKVSVT
jgi:hypothetical protein